MSDYVIMSDTGSDIDFATLREWGVGFRGLTFHFEGGREYQEGEMSMEEFYSRMRAGEVSRTSAVNSESFKELFEEALERYQIDIQNRKLTLKLEGEMQVKGDKELLRKMYTQLFSKESFVEEYESDNAARYLARLFIDYDEWMKIREELESQGWNYKVGYFKSLRVKYPDDVLSDKEKMSAAAHYHLVHEVEVPEKRTVEESILAINKEDEGGMTILYSVYVYHD